MRQSMSILFGLMATVSFTSLSAMACDIQEAQFIGKVKNHYDVQTDEVNRQCFFNLDLIQLNPSDACPQGPLTIEDLSRVEFWDYDCQYDNGMQLSGVIAKKDGRVYLESVSK